MKKILLALGFRDLEDYIKEEMSDGKEYEFVGESVHRENVLNLIKEKSPNILIIRETLPGKINIIRLIDVIRSNYQNIRIIFLAGEREVGDTLLSALVSYGVYDILHTGSIPANEIINLIQNPNSYKDVRHLQVIPNMTEDSSELELLLPEEDEEPEDEFDLLEDERRKVNEAEIEEEEDEEDDENEEAEKKRQKKKRKKIKMPNIKIPKIELPFEKHSDKKNKKEKIVEKEVRKEKIITFWGAKNGIGTSTIAHNMAVSLANSGNKVIYVELDNEKPSVAYWYDLGNLSEGIETFLKYLKKQEYKKIKDTIIRTRDLKEGDNKYNILPDSLDFLFFSKEYLSKTKKEPLIGALKDLYMYLLYQVGYDFVILDIAKNVKRQDLIDMLMFSNLVYIVASQDVSSLGYHTLDLNKLMKEGINIKNKSHYIINKYLKSSLDSEKIKKWLEVENLTLIPDIREVCIESNINSRPIETKTKEGILFNRKLKDLKKII